MYVNPHWKILNGMHAPEAQDCSAPLDLASPKELFSWLGIWPKAADVTVCLHTETLLKAESQAQSKPQPRPFIGCY
jgi:hypothetical protein